MRPRRMKRRDARLGLRGTWRAARLIARGTIRTGVSLELQPSGKDEKKELRTPAAGDGDDGKLFGCSHINQVDRRSLVRIAQHGLQFLIAAHLGVSLRFCDPARAGRGDEKYGQGTDLNSNPPQPQPDFLQPTNISIHLPPTAKRLVILLLQTPNLAP